jgi:hypothetical protein
MLFLLALTQGPKLTARKVPKRHPGAKWVIDRPPPANDQTHLHFAPGCKILVKPSEMKQLPTKIRRQGTLKNLQ